MAIVTKIYLQEQVRSLLNGGDPSVAAKFEPRMVLSHIQSVVNKMLRMDFLQVVLPSGETIPGHLATYDNVAVEAYKGVSRSQLPAMPVSLPHGMGVYHISLTSDINNPFIPMGAGQYALVNVQNMISGLLDQVGFEIVDGYAIYTEDLTARTVPVTAVLMRLVVMDFEKYDDYDFLPLTADMAADVVQQVYALLMQTPEPDKRVDSLSNENQRQQ